MANEDLQVSLGLDAKPFLGGLQGVMQSLGGLKGAIAGIAVVGAGAFAFHSAAEMEQSLFRIQANARTAVGSLSDLSEAILHSASQTLNGAFSGNELAAALAEVVNEADSAAEALQLVEAAGRLAAVTGGDLAQTSQSLADVLSAFGKEASFASDAADVLFEVSRQTGTGVDELATTLESLAAQAQGLGLSFEDTAILAGVLKDAGVDSAQGLLQAWAQIGNVGSRANEAFEGMGVAIRNTDGSIRPIVDLLAEFQANALAMGLSSEQVGEQLSQAFGARGASAALALINRTDELARVQGALADSTGSLTTAFDNGVQTSTAAQSRFDDLTTTLGQQLLPIVNAVLGVFVDFFDALSRMGLIDDLGKALVAVAASLAVYKVAVLGAAFAHAVFGVAAAPVTIAILAVAAAVAGVVLIWTHWDDILNFFSVRWENFKTGLQTLWDKLGPFAKSIEAVIFVFTHWEDVVAAVIDVFRRVDETISEFAVRALQLGLDIVRGIAQGIRNGISFIIEAAREVGQAVVNTIDSIFDFGSPSRLMEGYGENIAAGLALGIENGMGAARDAMQNLSSGALDVSVGAGGRSAQVGSRVSIGRIVINANSREGGVAAADGLTRELDRLGVLW